MFLKIPSHLAIVTSIKGNLTNSIWFYFQTPKEYEREYSRELQQKGVEASKFHGFAYDGIWVIAKTLTRVMELLRVKQRQNTFHNFTVDDREVGKMVLDVMNETNFFGVTVSYGTVGHILNVCGHELKLEIECILLPYGVPAISLPLSTHPCHLVAKLFNSGEKHTVRKS